MNNRNFTHPPGYCAQNNQFTTEVSNNFIRNSNNFIPDSQNNSYPNGNNFMNNLAKNNFANNRNQLNPDNNCFLNNNFNNDQRLNQINPPRNLNTISNYSRDQFNQQANRLMMRPNSNWNQRTNICNVNREIPRHNYRDDFSLNIPLTYQDGNEISMIQHNNKNSEQNPEQIENYNVNKKDQKASNNESLTSSNANNSKNTIKKSIFVVSENKSANDRSKPNENSNNNNNNINEHVNTNLNNSIQRIQRGNINMEQTNETVPIINNPFNNAYNNSITKYMKQGRNKPAMRGQSSRNFLMCVCPESAVEVNKVSTSKIQCKSCFNYQHKKCLSEAINMKNYECHICQFKKMDYYLKHITTLTRHLFVKYEDRVFNSDFMFELPIAKIKRQYEARNIKNPYFLVFRSLRLDSRGYEHHWPYNFSVEFNNKCKKELVLKGPPRAKGRIDYPFIFYLNKEDANKLNKNQFIPMDYMFDFNQVFTKDDNTFNLKVDYPANNRDKSSYVFQMDLVECKENVMDIIKELPIYESKDEVLKKVYREKSNDILFDKELISFIDLYSKTKKIEFPGRSSNCMHFTVFDLKIFLTFSKKNKYSECPICKVKCVDLYIDKIIDDYIKANTDKNEIWADANYNFCSENDKGNEKRNDEKLNENISNNIKVNNSNSEEKNFLRNAIESFNRKNNTNSNDIHIIDLNDEDEKESEIQNNNEQNRLQINFDINRTNDLSNKALIKNPTEITRQTNTLNRGTIESDNIVCLFTDDEIENENDEDKNKNTKNDLNYGNKEANHSMLDLNEEKEFLEIFKRKLNDSKQMETIFTNDYANECKKGPKPNQAEKNINENQTNFAPKDSYKPKRLKKLNEKEKEKEDIRNHTYLNNKEVIRNIDLLEFLDINEQTPESIYATDLLYDCILNKHCNQLLEFFTKAFSN